MTDIYAEIERLEAIASEIRKQGYLQNCRLERASAGGTASGAARRQTRYARLRSGKGALLPNGAKSQYIPLEKIDETGDAIARGRELQKIEKQIAKLRVRALQALAGTSKASMPSEIDNFCKNLFQWLQAHMSVDTVTLLLPDAKTQDLTVGYTIGLEEEISQRIHIPFGQGFAGKIARNKAPLFVKDLSAVEVVSPVLRNRGLRSLAGLPLQLGHNRVGVLHVGTFRPRKFSRQDVQKLQLVVDLLQSVITNKALYNLDSCGKAPANPSLWRNAFHSPLRKLYHSLVSRRCSFNTMNYQFLAVI